MQKLIKINPEDTNALLNLADSYNLSNDQNLATTYYKQIVDLTESAAQAYHYYERAQAQAHLGDYNQALKTLATAQKEYAETADLAYSAAIVHTLSGNHNAAIVEVEQALQRGIDTIWFQSSWFEPLCTYPIFRNLLKNDVVQTCSP